MVRIPKRRLARTRRQSPRFVMKEGDKQATAIESGVEFVVLAGSRARKSGAPSWMSYRGRRDAPLASGKLADSDHPETDDEIVRLFGATSTDTVVVRGRWVYQAPSFMTSS